MHQEKFLLHTNFATMPILEPAREWILISHLVNAILDLLVDDILKLSVLCMLLLKLLKLIVKLKLELIV